MGTVNNVKRLFLFFVFTLNGCATLGSAEMFVACQVGDIISTQRALTLSATAYETSPIPVPLLFAIKIALASWVWFHREEWNSDEESKGTRALATIVSCAPIPGNLAAAKK